MVLGRSSALKGCVILHCRPRRGIQSSRRFESGSVIRLGPFILVNPDVVKQIKLIIEHFGPRLAIGERNLFSIACKNITDTLRNSLRVVNTLLKWQSERSLERRTNQLALIRRQCNVIEQELNDVCKDILALLDNKLIPAARKGEEGVFYSKM